MFFSLVEFFVFQKISLIRMTLQLDSTYLHIFTLASRKNYENVNQIITTERMLIWYTTINFLYYICINVSICIHSYFVGRTFHFFKDFLVLCSPFSRFINPGEASIITIFRMFFQIIKWLKWFFTKETVMFGSTLMYFPNVTM